MANTLKEYCDDVKIEPFEVHPKAFFNWIRIAHQSHYANHRNHEVRNKSVSAYVITHSPFVSNVGMLDTYVRNVEHESNSRRSK